jgi:hypothetical protein
MLENYRTGAVRNRCLRNMDIRAGLEAAGFTTVTGVAEKPVEIGTRAALFRSAPNPSRGTTTIPFRLAAPGRISLTLCDVRGRRIRVLYEGAAPAGESRVPVDMRDLPAGVYFYRLTCQGESRARSFVSLR